MGWFRKEDEAKVPEKLRNLTPEQIVQAIESGEKSATEMAALKVELDKRTADGAETQNTIRTLQDQVKNLEMNKRVQSSDQSKENQEVGFADDPELYVQQQIAKNTVPTAVATLKATAMLAREQARRQLDRLRVPGTNISKGALFEKWSGDIDKAVEKVALQYLQEPQQWIYVFNNILGTHTDEILSLRAEGKEPDYLQAEPAYSEIGRRQEEKKDDKLTDVELDIAKRMKITPEQYLANKKSLGATQNA